MPGDVAPADEEAARLAARIRQNREQALQRRLRRQAEQQQDTATRAGADGGAAAAEAQPVVVSQAAAETQAGVVSQAQAVRENMRTCVICHEDLGDDANNVQALECMHVYHKACVREYMSATGCSFRMACPLKCFWNEGAPRPFSIVRAAAASSSNDGVDNGAVANGTSSGSGGPSASSDTAITAEPLSADVAATLEAELNDLSSD